MKTKKTREELECYEDGLKDGKEDILEVLRKYPISANFDDAMGVLKFKEKVKAETLAEVGKVIDKRKCCFKDKRDFEELKKELGI